jgi:potassium efflux system protein
MRMFSLVWHKRLYLFLQTIIIIFFLTSLPAAVPAQAPPPEFKATLSGWQATFDKAAGRLSRGGLDDAEYEDLRADLASLSGEARRISAGMSDELRDNQQLADALGAPPGEGDPLESQAVAADRQRLTRIIADLDGHRRQAELMATRADMLMDSAADKRMRQFTDALLLRNALPLDPATWTTLPAQGEFLRDRISRAFSAVMAKQAWREHAIELTGAFVLAFGVAWPLRRRLRSRFGHRSLTTTHPTRRERVMAMAAEAVGRCLLTVLPVMGVAVAILATLGGDSKTAPIQALTIATAGGICIYLFFSGMGRAVLAPSHPAWQLSGVEPASASGLAWRITLFALGSAVAGAAIVLQSRLLSPPELQAITGFAALFLATATFLPLLPAKLWRGVPVEREPSTENAISDASAIPAASTSSAFHGSWGDLRFLAGAASLLALGASLAGYRNFSIYVAKLSLAAVAVAGMLFLVRGVARELLIMAMECERGLVAEVRRLLVRSQKGLEAAGWIGRVLIDTLLIALGGAILLPLSGIDWSELQGMFSAFMDGVTIGGVRLAPADMIAASLLFSLAVMVTRYVQRTLDVRVLQRLQIDLGVQNSIRTGVGYFGFIMAMLVAIGALGLDLSNLALVAGALSVGIGFGLQNVVSNFAAGLILLVERPIKVGDWVIVGGKEGVVKRISVRATELQTFQRASVIIPNSELVSTAVVNWTFKDKFGRVDIKIGVKSGSNLALVRETLLACANAHRQVASSPGAFVVFQDFNGSTMNFELRCFVRDVDFYLATASDLRFAIVEAFESKGIVIA